MDGRMNGWKYCIYYRSVSPIALWRIQRRMNATAPSFYAEGTIEWALLILALPRYPSVCLKGQEPWRSSASGHVCVPMLPPPHTSFVCLLDTADRMCVCVKLSARSVANRLSASWSCSAWGFQFVIAKAKRLSQGMRRGQGQRGQPSTRDLTAGAAQHAHTHTEIQ